MSILRLVSENKGDFPLMDNIVFLGGGGSHFGT